jgi:hypothetical protein
MNYSGFTVLRFCYVENFCGQNKIALKNLKMPPKKWPHIFPPQKIQRPHGKKIPLEISERNFTFLIKRVGKMVGILHCGAVLI